jgi:FMN phosphatase YigB (HAD superfamily)
MLDVSRIRVPMFDCVNTVFDVSSIAREQMVKYIEQVRRPEWAPLALPQGWVDCLAHADSAGGINRISKKFITATCSNWHASALAWLSWKAGIDWSAIVPMEAVRAYKPADIAYLNVANVLNVEPSQVLMVTANETAPDIEAAQKLGMQAILIDRKNKYGGKYPRTIIELAEMLDA